MFHTNVNDVVTVTKKAAESNLFRVKNPYYLRENFIHKCRMKGEIKVKIGRVTYNSSREEDGEVGVVEIVKISPIEFSEGAGVFWYVLAKDVDNV